MHATLTLALQFPRISFFILLLKFAAGIIGHSAAMIADAIHSLTDFATDAVVMVCVTLGNKPVDKSHDYGHGKFETLATALIALALFVVGVMICYSGATKILSAMMGETLEQPGMGSLAIAWLGLRTIWLSCALLAIVCFFLL